MVIMESPTGFNWEGTPIPPEEQPAPDKRRDPYWILWGLLAVLVVILLVREGFVAKEKIRQAQVRAHEKQIWDATVALIDAEDAPGLIDKYERLPVSAKQARSDILDCLVLCNPALISGFDANARPSGLTPDAKRLATASLREKKANAVQLGITQDMVIQGRARIKAEKAEEQRRRKEEERLRKEEARQEDEKRAQEIDRAVAKKMGMTEEEVREARKRYGIRNPYEPVEYELKLIDWNWSKSSEYHVKAQGQVKNITTSNLDNIEAVVTYYTKDKQFICSDSALVEYNPILPGQTSPFGVISTYNPAMATATVEFKRLGGGTVMTKQ